MMADLPIVVMAICLVLSSMMMASMLVTDLLYRSYVKCLGVHIRINSLTKTVDKPKVCFHYVAFVTLTRLCE